MTLKVAIQMDPIGPINIDADSTFRIALEAQARGHELFYYTPDRLFYREGRVMARGWPLELRRVKGDHYTLGAETEVDLGEMDVVWLRQDPPFDMGYITTTHLLDMIHPGTLVVNDPAWVRNSPEKIFVTEFADLMPETLITKDAREVEAFQRPPSREMALSNMPLGNFFVPLNIMCSVQWEIPVLPVGSSREPTLYHIHDEMMGAV